MHASESGSKRKVNELVPIQAFDHEESGSKRIKWLFALPKDYHMCNIETSLSKDLESYKEAMTGTESK